MSILLAFKLQHWKFPTRQLRFDQLSSKTNNYKNDRPEIFVKKLTDKFCCFISIFIAELIEF